MRIYFDLTDGLTLLRDERGVESPSLDEACRQAGTAIREMHGTGDLGEDRSGWHIIIRDAHGVIHRTIAVDHPRDRLEH